MFFSNAPARFAEAGLNALVFFLVWLGLWLPIALPMAIWLKWRPFQPVTSDQKLPLLGSLYLLAPLVLWGADRWIGGGNYGLSGLGLSGLALRSIGVGLALGSLGLLGMFAFQRALGWLAWQLPVSTDRLFVARTLILTLLLGLWISLTEELIFRGFLLNQFQRDDPAWGLSAWLAGAIVSLIFALLHLVWEGRENIPQLPGLWLMGMVLVVARWADHGSLGLAWGLHAGWIWAIASLDTTQAIQYNSRVSQWLTGWGGKPLAGGVGLLALLLTGLAIGGLPIVRL